MKIGEVIECPVCGHQSRLSLGDRPDPDEKIIECGNCFHQGEAAAFNPEAEDGWGMIWKCRLTRYCWPALGLQTTPQIFFDNSLYPDPERTKQSFG